MAEGDASVLVNAVKCVDICVHACVCVSEFARSVLAYDCGCSVRG